MADESTTGPDAELIRDGWIQNGGFSNYAPDHDRWATFNLVTATGDIASVHNFKIDSFVHYIDAGGSCSCGPHIVVYDNALFGPVSMITHNEWDSPQDPEEDEDDEWEIT